MNSGVGASNSPRELGGNSAIKADKYRFGNQLDAEFVINSSADFPSQPQDVFRFRAATVDQSEGVFAGYADRSNAIAFRKSGALDQPRGRSFDFS